MARTTNAQIMEMLNQQAQQIEQLTNIVAAILTAETPTETQAETQAEKPAEKPKFSVFADMVECTRKTYGKPAITGDRGTWSWAAWKNQPTDATIAKYKADGWRYSKKASNREGMFCMYCK